MPIIVESSQTNADLVLSVTGGKSQVVGNLEELKRVLTESPLEYAVVLGPNVDLEAAAALADTLRVTRPAVSVILIRRRVDTIVLAEALRSGMREVVDERDLTGLGSAVKRAHEVWQALNGGIAAAHEGTRGKLVTVFSPKGGVGKTTLAVNLAVALSARGERRVCLVDLDLAFGDVAITLQLFPARSIADATHLESGLDFGVLEPLLTEYKDGLQALVAPVQPDARDTIAPALVGRILGLLKSHFDFVVVDTSPAFDEYVLQALDETDELLLVTTLDVPHPEERQGRRGDPRPAQLPPSAQASGLEPCRRQGRAQRGEGREHPGDERRGGHTHLLAGGACDQLRGADRQRPAEARGDPGGGETRRAGRHRRGARRGSSSTPPRPRGAEVTGGGRTQAVPAPPERKVGHEHTG